MPKLGHRPGKYQPVDSALAQLEVKADQRLFVSDSLN